MDKLFVIGDPISQSKSPAIHNYWIKKYSLDAIYDKLQVKKEQIPNLLEKIRNGEIKGLNITIPFKKTVIPYLDELESSAQKSVAVNTIFRRENKLVGTNTDGKGLLKSITEDLKFTLNPNFNIFCLGAGGASYGIISELTNLNPSAIWISNRTLTTAKNLVRHFQKFHPNINFSAHHWGENPESIHNLLINTTTVGMNENDTINLNLNDLPLGALVYDIIYNPPKTVLMKKAEERNLRTTNGSFMLVRQAAEAFTKWFGIEPKNDDIQGALKILNDNA